MANGQRTIGAVEGATAGAAAGPIGAIAGGAAGYLLGAIQGCGLFGHKKKPPPTPPPQSFLQRYGLWLGVAGVAVLVVGGGVAIIVLNRRK